MIWSTLVGGPGKYSLDALLRRRLPNRHAGL
jgi:hypothetical protein